MAKKTTGNKGGWKGPIQSNNNATAGDREGAATPIEGNLNYLNAPSHIGAMKPFTQPKA